VERGTGSSGRGAAVRAARAPPPTHTPPQVVHGVGLIVSIAALLSADGGFVHAGDGAALWRVRFRAAAFRPAPGDVLTGTVVSVDPGGARVSLGFFDDVSLPRDGLPPPSTFDAARRAWLHTPPDAADGDEPLDVAPGAVVRVRVREARFDAPPPGGGAPGGAPHAPLVVVADCGGVGMGPVAWWTDCEEVAAAGDG